MAGCCPKAASLIVRCRSESEIAVAGLAAANAVIDEAHEPEAYFDHSMLSMTASNSAAESCLGSLSISAA
jgi:hypothetical protein